MSAFDQIRLPSVSTGGAAIRFGGRRNPYNPRNLEALTSPYEDGTELRMSRYQQEIAKKLGLA